MRFPDREDNLLKAVEGLQVVACMDRAEASLALSSEAWKSACALVARWPLPLAQNAAAMSVAWEFSLLPMVVAAGVTPRHRRQVATCLVPEWRALHRASSDWPVVDKHEDDAVEVEVRQGSTPPKEVWMGDPRVQTVRQRVTVEFRNHEVMLSNATMWLSGSGSIGAQLWGAAALVLARAVPELHQLDVAGVHPPAGILGLRRDILDESITREGVVDISRLDGNYRDCRELEPLLSICSFTHQSFIRCVPGYADGDGRLVLFFFDPDEEAFGFLFPLACPPLEVHWEG